jgi:hypothetical protein
MGRPGKAARDIRIVLSRYRKALAYEGLNETQDGRRRVSGDGLGLGQDDGGQGPNGPHCHIPFSPKALESLHRHRRTSFTDGSPFRHVHRA